MNAAGSSAYESLILSLPPRELIEDWMESPPTLTPELEAESWQIVHDWIHRRSDRDDQANAAHT